MRRRRYQTGSLQRRKHGKAYVWVALWREDGSRRYKTLGKCSQMSQSDARAKLNEIVRPLNMGASEAEVVRKKYTFGDFVTDVYIPFQRRKWKGSTAGTTEQRIRTHLITELASRNCVDVKRDELQDLLDRKASAGLSHSVVDHLRWGMRSIFRLAVND